MTLVTDLGLLEVGRALKTVAMLTDDAVYRERRVCHGRWFGDV